MFAVTTNHNVCIIDSNIELFNIVFFTCNFHVEKYVFKFIIPNIKYKIGHTIPKTNPGGCQSALISFLL